MGFPDMRTIYAGYVLITAVGLVVAVSLWIQNRRQFRGLGLWTADFALHFAGTALFSLRGLVPDFFSVLVSNVMIVGGFSLLYAGLEDFCGLRGKRFQNWIYLGAFTAVFACFIYLLPDLAMRNAVFSLSILFMASQCAWLLLFRVPRIMRKETKWTGLIFSAFAVVNLIRLVCDLALPAADDVFGPTPVDTWVILSYGVLFLFLMFSLVLLVNQRLQDGMTVDMRARRKAEEVIRLRLRLWEYAADHGFSDLMQRALDEIEALTDSSIGFYHFVNESDRTLSLGTWSTKTQREFCHADGQGMTYDIDRAGVWADAVREKRPVIHNDFASLENRKGMPEGHAEVTREIVVPTMRDGKVVAVLGVGNKESEYSKEDVELVDFIADLVYSIVEKKIADERIFTLNDKLERLAMTDELTELPNRRAFFNQAKKEVARSKRHGLPCALLLLDLDGFKAVNDLYGHDSGDAALKRVSGVLRTGVRETDLAARFGGEEFTVLLPQTGMEEAYALADRLRKGIEDACAETAEDPLRVTASIGIAILEDGVDDVNAFIKRADEAMYNAKALGKNRVYPSLEYYRKRQQA